MPTDQELWTIQARVTAALLDRGEGLDERRLREAAGILADGLSQVVRDDEFWAAVADPAAGDVEPLRLGAVLAVDWQLVLRECGLSAEDATAQAGDLIFAAAAATGPFAEWDTLRARMAELARRLAQDADDEEPHGGGWWHAARARIGFGLGALRRVSLKKLLLDTARGGGQAALSAVIAGMVGGPPLQVAQFIGVMAGRLGFALYDELVRGWREEGEARESERLRELYAGSPIFEFGRFGRIRSDARLLDHLPDLLTEEAGQIVERIRAWIAQLGVDVVNMWSHVVACSGRIGADALRGVVAAVGEVRASLASLVTGAGSGDGLMRAVDDLRNRAETLVQLLFAGGALGRHP